MRACVRRRASRCACSSRLSPTPAAALIPVGMEQKACIQKLRAALERGSQSQNDVPALLMELKAAAEVAGQSATEQSIS